MPGECKYCGRPKEGNAGDYYHESDCHKANVWARITKALEPDSGVSPKEIAALRAEYEVAAYVGD